MTPRGPTCRTTPPGEARQSNIMEDPEHWVAVYEELIGFLLGVQEPDCDKVSSFHRRLEYWRHRRDELVR